MAGIAVHGLNVKFMMDSTNIEGLREIPEFNKPAKETIDVTCLASPKKEYIPGLADSVSELTFKFLYSAKLFSDMEKAEAGEHQYTLTLSDGSTFVMKGEHVTIYHGGGVNTAAEMSITITLKEAPVFTAGNSQPSGE